MKADWIPRDAINLMNDVLPSSLLSGIFQQKRFFLHLPLAFQSVCDENIF